MKITKTTVVGATHGNELTGAYLVNNQAHGGRTYSYQLEYFLANKQALQHNKRYLEKDLNRCFKQADLENENLTRIEEQLAKSINQKLGPKGSLTEQMIIDLHTSTAPMGVNLVLLKTDLFHLKLVDYVQKKMPESKVTVTLERMADHHFLMSMAEQCVLIEVGAVPQGVLRDDVYQQSERALELILEYVELHNVGALPEPSPSVEILEYFAVEYLPTDEAGNITGMVHSNIQDRDFSLLQTGEPIFRLFDGQELFYQGQPAMISFINEAAYYDQKKAFSLSKKSSYRIE